MNWLKWYIMNCSCRVIHARSTSFEVIFSVQGHKDHYWDHWASSFMQLIYRTLPRNVKSLLTRSWTTPSFIDTAYLCQSLVHGRLPTVSTRLTCVSHSFTDDSQLYLHGIPVTVTRSQTTHDYDSQLYQHSLPVSVTRSWTTLDSQLYRHSLPVSVTRSQTTHDSQ